MANPTVYNSANNGQTYIVSNLTNPNGIEVTTSTTVVPTVTLDVALVGGTLTITADSGATANVSLTAGATGTLDLIANGGDVEISGALAALTSGNATIEDGGVFTVDVTSLAVGNSFSATFGASMGFTNTMVLNDTNGLLNLTTTKAIGGFFAGGQNVIDDKLVTGTAVLSYTVAKTAGQPDLVTLWGANNTSLGTLSFAEGSFTQWQAGTYAVTDPAGPLNITVGSDGGITIATDGYVMTGGGNAVPLPSTPGVGSTQTLVATNGTPDNVTGSHGNIYLANSQANISGGANTMYLDGSPNNLAMLWNTSGAWDNVIGNNGTIALNNAITGVVGGGNTVNFASGTGNVASLWNTLGNWDNVVGSNGTVALNNAISGIVGAANTITFASGAGNVASLWNTAGTWDNVFGSNGTVGLNNAKSGVVGGGNTVDFASGTGNVASLWNTGSAWDNVVGSNGMVLLNNAISGVVGGGNTVNFTSGSGNGASLWNTNGAADSVTGSNGAVYINNADAFITGVADTIVFANPGTNNVGVTGTSENFVFQPVAGHNTISGFDAATDQLYLKATQFGSSFAAFLANDVTMSGTDTLITDPNNSANVIDLNNTASSVLTAANTHFS